MDYIRFYNAHANSTGDLASLANSILVPSEDDSVIVSDSTDSILVPEMKKSQSANISTLTHNEPDKCEVLPVMCVLNEELTPLNTRLSIRVMEVSKPDYIYYLIKRYDKQLKFIETTPNEYNINEHAVVLRGFESIKDSRWTYMHYAESQLRCTLKPQLCNVKRLYLNEFTSPYVSINFDNVTSYNGMFAAMDKLEDIIIERFDMKHITSMEEAFMDCINLKTITIVDCDLSAIQTMANFCRGCKSLKIVRFIDCKLNIRCDYHNAFYDCPLLDTLAVPKEIIAAILENNDLCDRGIKFK